MFKRNFWLPLDLQLFADGDAAADSGVEGASAAGEQPQGDEGSAQTGAEGQAAAEPQNNYEKAFAKRLAAEREKWDSERKTELEKFKDFDTYKLAAEFLQRQAEVPDMLTLREQIELAELQERADKEKVPAAVMKRIDQLEAKAARGEELEAAQKQKDEWQAFESSLKTFVEGKTIDGKPVDHMELWKYMHENDVSKPEVALRAMKADMLEKSLETARTDAVNEYLKSKQATKTDGSPGAAAQAAPGAPTTWKDAESRLLSRVKAAREAQ